MSKLSEETIRKKRLFAAHLQSFIKKYSLTQTAAADLLDADGACISSWLSGKTSPYLSRIPAYRKIMKDYADAHAPDEAVAVEDKPEITGEEGISLTISGGNLQYSAVISKQQAGVIISSLFNS